jgi:hypothetical protein
MREYLGREQDIIVGNGLFCRQEGEMMFRVESVFSALA